MDQLKICDRDQTKETNCSTTQTKRQTKGYIQEAYEYAKNQAKWAAAKEWCADRGYEFKVLTENELGIK